MSKWTSIIGAIEVEDFSCISDQTQSKVSKTCKKIQKIFERNSPVGSEGGLSIKVNIDDHNRSQAWFSVSICGHLRDFSGKSDAKNATDWLLGIYSDTCIQHPGLKIRQLVVDIKDWGWGWGTVIRIDETFGGIVVDSYRRLHD